MFLNLPDNDVTVWLLQMSHLSVYVMLSQHVLWINRSKSYTAHPPSFYGFCLCVCCQVVFEVAFNSARGGYVAIDDISFSPEFCHTDTGEETHLDLTGVKVDHKDRLFCISVLVQFGSLLNLLDSKSH